MLYPAAASSGSSTTKRWLIGVGLTDPAGRSSLSTTARWTVRKSGRVRRRTTTSGTLGPTWTHATRAHASRTHTGTTWTTRTAASTWAAASRCIRRDLPRELPEVVARGAAERSDRCLLILAGDTTDATHRCAGLRRSARRSGNATTWRGRARRDELPLAIFGERILELLSQVATLDEHVEIRGECADSSLVGGNRARILHAAKDRFFFLLALGFVSPHRHGDGHEDGHDGHHHEQRRHRVSTLAAPIGLTS